MLTGKQMHVDAEPVLSCGLVVPIVALLQSPVSVWAQIEAAWVVNVLLYSDSDQHMQLLWDSGAVEQLIGLVGNGNDSLQDHVFS